MLKYRESIEKWTMGVKEVSAGSAMPHDYFNQGLETCKAILGVATSSTIRKGSIKR